MGHLTIIRQIDPPDWTNQKQRTWWLGICACGTTREVNSANLSGSPNISCGCQDMKCSIPGSRKHRDPRDVTINAIINSYKQRCKRNNIKWGLSREKAKTLLLGNCQYCGIEPYNKRNAYGHLNRRTQKAQEWQSRAEITVNGIDRSDNSLGYTATNSVTCCKICNYAKRDLPLDEFLIWLRKVQNNG